MKLWEEQFKDSASKGELEIFTCLSLSIGVEGGITSNAWKMCAGIAFLFAMQIAIPLMMISFRTEELGSVETPVDIRFRLTGFLVYMYSIKNMHDNALDDCRTVLLNIAVHYPLSWAHVWPALLGEFVNTFVSMFMAATLFVNFLSQAHPADLVINAVSLNFLGSLDNDITDDGMISDADRLFDQLVEEGPKVVQSAAIQYYLVKAACYFLFALRIVGTMLGGSALGLIFVFSKEKDVMDYVCDLSNDSFAFCQ